MPTPTRSAATALAAASLALAACGPAPEPGPRVVAEGGAWTWFNDERAMVADGHLVVGFVDTAGYPSVRVEPVEGGVPSRSYRVGSFRERDDHNNPALLVLDTPGDDGPGGSGEAGEGEGGVRILAAWAPHNTRPFWWWRHGTLAGDSVAWGPEERTDELGATATYANLFRLAGEGGRIYDFFRGINFNPTVMTSDDGGATWSEPHHFMAVGTGRTRPYVKYASDGEGRIDFLYTQAHPRQEANHVYHVYYADGFLHRSDGAPIQPMPDGGTGPLPVAAGTLVYDAATAGRAWVWDLEYDDGAPVAAYIAARDSTLGLDLRYRYARWDPAIGGWRDGEIARAGTRLYRGENHYAGGIAIDPAHPSTVYISADVDPVTGEPTEHYQIYRGRRAAGAWSWEALTADPTADNIRPTVTRAPGGGPRVLLWLRGRYAAYTDFATDILALVLE